MVSVPMVVGLGEVLWDVFPDRARFGGAPANFACSAAGLGGQSVNVEMVSAVGLDEFGDHALRTLELHGVGTRGVQRNSQPTGRVDVTLDVSGAPAYLFADPVAWDALEWAEPLEQLARSAAIVCFGTLAQRSVVSRQTIYQFLDHVRKTSTRLLDMNLRQPYWNPEIIIESLQRADILKLNSEELPVVASVCRLSGSTIDVIRQIADRFNLQLVALTRGDQGSLLVRGPQVSDAVATEVKDPIVDTVGAGDAFTAAVAIGFLRGMALSEMNERAGEVAAWLCTQRGATPDIPRRFSALFGGLPGMI